MFPNPLDVVVDGPEPGEACTCGAPAVWVYVTPDFGRVSYCGVPQGRP